MAAGPAAWPAPPTWTSPSRPVPGTPASCVSFAGDDRQAEEGVLVGRSMPLSTFKAPEPAQPWRGPHLFQDKIVFILMLVLGLPAISCAAIASHPSVLYWVGRSGLVVPTAAMLWVLLSHEFLARKVVKRRLAVILVLVIPTASMMLAAHGHKVTAVGLRAKLETEDCLAFHGKARLERAWQEARQILDACVERQANLTGAPGAEVERVTSLRLCPGYAKGQARWAREWGYLEALEATQRCAGWCSAERPLWRTFLGEAPHDRCSLVAAEMLGGEVHRTARQVVVYCAFALLFLGSLFSTVEL
mmetsp:Transcript_112628/g.342813  ORF Transcript_112628/g.342813 Transcript_112628/m.342813 type:complete len:303 (-) Transcript_112628:47-955(-)